MQLNNDEISLEVEMLKEEQKYILIVKVNNTSNKTLSFNFSNLRGELARNCLYLFDEHKEEVKLRGEMYISPLPHLNPTTTNIMPQESATFKLPAKILPLENHSFLEFKGVNFNVIRGRKYVIQMQYKGINSNMHEFIID